MAREMTYNNILKYHSWHLCQILLLIMQLPIPIAIVVPSIPCCMVKQATCRVVKFTTLLFKSLCSNVAKQVASFLLPVFL